MENLERQQKQTIERLEQEHTNRLRDEAKRIKAEQDKELAKYQNMLKNRKKEVSTRFTLLPLVKDGRAYEFLFLAGCFDAQTSAPSYTCLHKHRSVRSGPPPFNLL